MSQSETKTMPEAREFELFYSGFTGGLIVRPSRSATVMLANNQSDDEYIDVIEKKAYSALKAECERLQTDIDKHLGLFEESIRHSFKEREDKLKSENAALVVENEKLKEELDAYRFYADDATKELVWIEIDKKEAP